MSLQLEETRKEQTAFNAPASGKGRWLLITLTALVVAALIGWVYWQRSTKAPEAVASVAAASTGTVTFLMEQQWRVHMMLAKAESRQVTRQISATGRIIPAAQNQAIVAPPVGGLIAGSGLPRIGQSVARGQTIALLRQTPTAAETSQIAAANAQLRLEVTRLESERRGMTEKLNATKAEMDEPDTITSAVSGCLPDRPFRSKSWNRTRRNIKSPKLATTPQSNNWKF